MKITKSFILREIAGDYVLVPVGETALKFNGMITVNETGAFLWERLLEGCTEEALRQAVLEAYDVTEEEAVRDLREFIGTLKEKHILEE